jgi:uncharacterized protein (DUF1501 family)
MAIDRRSFVRTGALGAAVLGLGPLAKPAAALAAEATGDGRHRTLVCIFQRGGADGLSMVVPYADPRYHALRPTLGVAAPGGKGGPDALDLDGFFGLHPALGPLRPLYKQKMLAAVHAVGTPVPIQSHTEAQAYVETGLQQAEGRSVGWLNRLAGAVRAAPGTVPAATVGTSVPRILEGPAPLLHLSSLSEPRVRRNWAEMPSGQPEVLLQRAGRIDFDGYRASHGADYPNTELGEELRRLAALIKADVGVGVACVDSHGWDTHLHQGAGTGPLALRLEDLSRSVAAFVTDLGDRMGDVTVLTLSEFGRTLAENASGGTDHGQGSALFVMGGKVKGGKVYGRWPGLDAERLEGKNVLPATTDVRAVCAEVAAQHLGTDRLPELFPGHTFNGAERLGLF